MLRYKLANKCL